MKKKYYVVTKLNDEDTAILFEGFDAIAKLLNKGYLLKFRAFASEEVARTYMKTGVAGCCGHARPSVKRSSVRTHPYGETRASKSKKSR